MIHNIVYGTDGQALCNQAPAYGCNVRGIETVAVIKRTDFSIAINAGVSTERY